MGQVIQMPRRRRQMGKRLRGLGYGYGSGYLYGSNGSYYGYDIYSLINPPSSTPGFTGLPSGLSNDSANAGSELADPGSLSNLIGSYGSDSADLIAGAAVAYGAAGAVSGSGAGGGGSAGGGGNPFGAAQNFGGGSSGSGSSSGKSPVVVINNGQGATSSTSSGAGSSAAALGSFMIPLLVVGAVVLLGTSGTKKKGS